MWNDGGEKHPLTFEEFRDCFLAFVLGLFCLNLYFHLKLYVYVSKRGFVHVSAVPGVQTVASHSTWVLGTQPWSCLFKSRVCSWAVIFLAAQFGFHLR